MKRKAILGMGSILILGIIFLLYSSVTGAYSPFPYKFFANVPPSDGIINATNTNTSDYAVAIRGEASSDQWVHNMGVQGISRGAGGWGVLGQAYNSYGVGVEGTTEGNLGIGVYGHAYASASEGRGVVGIAEPDNGIGVYGKGGANGYAAVFEGNVKIQSRNTQVTLLEFGEGLDYAEGFDVSDVKEILPGSVLVIDPDNPGKLCLSIRAYDNRVAGIVAGANGMGSGVRLGAEQFDNDVALAGRVYCNVDATQSAVKPGDLLTTSAIPGYAMKALDYSRAQGAILGKAMQRLEKGQKGQILVLVSLQ